MRLTGGFFAAASAFAAWLAAPVAPSPAVSYNNTLIQQRADPHISKHTDGWYYFTATVPEFDRIILRRAQSIQALQDAAETTIWRRKRLGVGSGQGTGDHPLTASWVEKGLIKTNWDTFSLDTSTFVANGTRYLIWAQQEPSRPDQNSSIMIAQLENPWTIRGTAVAISRPTLPWERIGCKVNEGPYVIQRNGKVFLTYSASASATDSNYCMGMLTATEGSDLLNPASWSKLQNPIFASNPKTNQWGPGHNLFAVSEDGLSDILVYHDRGYKDIRGDPLNDPNRRTKDFGVPVPEGNTPVRLRSAAGSGQYVRYYMGSDGPTGTPALADVQFRIASPGLAGGSTVSLESTSNPGMFLCRADDVGAQFVSSDALGSASAKASASFNLVPGLADGEAVSFEASDASDQYLRLEASGRLTTTPAEEDAQEQATFFLE
ncbi:glycosyl hydrolase [Thermothelomyces heterothallicus CBS 202.75]|uniref:glycosyl hydrolase n=1 Tax=Thermothelomyces heterothallicus CBS 202.75 TaxID=1149848 RepID=UPI00374291F7